MGFPDPIKALRQIFRHLQIENKVATMAFTGRLRFRYELYNDVL